MMELISGRLFISILLSNKMVLSFSSDESFQKQRLVLSDTCMIYLANHANDVPIVFRLFPLETREL
jgi:hypothetical protein